MCRLNNPGTWRRLEQFYAQAHAEYISGTPRLNHLPLLLGINILNALAGNAQALSMPGLWLDYDAVSPFCKQMTSQDHVQVLTTMRPLCPENLIPTEMQMTVVHHPWIDLFPLPRLRDNILRAIDGGLDEDDFCYDIVDVDNDSQSGKASLITWGSPAWDVNSWEVTPSFLHKWGWLLEGCEELMKATNHWRPRRGERLINLC